MDIPKNFSMLCFSAVNSFAINILSTLMLFLTSIFYTRTLGATEYGIYIYFSSWVAVLGIPAALGTREYFVREAAILISSSKIAAIKSLLRWGSLTTAKCYVITVLLTSLVAFGLGIIQSRDHLYNFLAALPLILFLAQIGMRYAILRGLDRIVLAQMPESLFRPFLQFILMLVAWAAFKTLKAWHLMLFSTIGACGAFFLINRFLAIALPKTQPEPGEFLTDAQNKIWLQSTLPFMVISGLYLINNQVNILMLGSMCDHKEAAVFKVASYGAEFISFLLIAVNTAIAPTLAKLWHAAEIAKLQRLVTISVRATVALTLPLTAILFVLSNNFLALFGNEFQQGSFVMRILCLAQFINISAGSVGLILNMSNNEKLTALGVAVATAINILMNLLLIPMWGINGAAISASTSLILWNILLLLAVRIKTRVKPSILGL